MCTCKLTNINDSAFIRYSFDINNVKNNNNLNTSIIDNRLEYHNQSDHIHGHLYVNNNIMVNYKLENVIMYEMNIISNVCNQDNSIIFVNNYI